MAELLHRWFTDDVGIVAANTYPSAVVVTDALRQHVRVLDIQTGAELFEPVAVGFRAGGIHSLEAPNQLCVSEAHRFTNTVAVDLATGWIRARPKPAVPVAAAPARQFPAALGEIVDWAYDPVRDQICGINHEHSAFFIPGAGKSAEYQRVPLAPFDAFNTLELYPEHRLMLVTCVDLNYSYSDGVAVYLWNLDRPGHQVRIAPESSCESIQNLRVDLSPDGALLLIQTDGRPSLHRTSDGAWVGNVDPAKNKPDWAAEYGEPFWPTKYFIRRGCGHIVALFHRCVQILDCATGALVAQTPPLQGRQRYTDGWIDAQGNHLILTRRFGDWFDNPKNRLDVFELPPVSSALADRGQ